MPTSRQEARASSFDHLVGRREDACRNLEADGARGLEVDDELEFGRLQHGKLGGLGALEDTAEISAGIAEGGHEIGAVARKPAEVDELAALVNGCQLFARGSGDKERDVAGEERV